MNKDCSPFDSVSALQLLEPTTLIRSPITPFLGSLFSVLCHTCARRMCLFPLGYKLIHKLFRALQALLNLLHWPLTAHWLNKRELWVYLGSISICCGWQEKEIALRQNQDAEGWGVVLIQVPMSEKENNISY